MTPTKIIKGFFIFIFIFILSVGVLYIAIEPMVQSAFIKGYDMGKNASCSWLYPNEWTNDDYHPTNKEINIITNFSFNASLN